jgi:hypothetical protein
MVFSESDTNLYFEKSERIDLLRKRIETTLGRIRQDLNANFASLKPQKFGAFPILGTEYTLEIFSNPGRQGEFCINVIRLVNADAQAKAYYFWEVNETIPAELVTPVYKILPKVLTHFSKLSPKFESDIKRIIDIKL